MTTLTITIDETTTTGKNLIARLKSAPAVSVKSIKPSTRKQKAKSIKNSDQKLGKLMRKSETGKLVSKETIMRALRVA